MNKKFFYSLILMVGIICLLFNITTSAYADTTISWGINPNTKEKTPEPPAGATELLDKHNGIFVKDTTDKKVYFTFDLGYEAGYTAQVLDILKENNIKALFFICGNYLKEKDLINRMIAEGHSIGNHTDKHKDLPKHDDETVKKDIVTLQESFKNEYGETPMKYFRPPFGRTSERVLKLTNEQNLKTVLWSIAIVDWGKTPINAAKSADKIASRVHPGAIILLHITNAGTPEMLKQLIPKLTEKGYSAGTAQEL